MRSRLLTGMMVSALCIAGFAAPFGGGGSASAKAVEAAVEEGPRSGLFLVPGVIGGISMKATGLLEAAGAQELYDYTEAVLVSIPDVTVLPIEVQSRIIPIVDADMVAYGAWVGPSDRMEIRDGGYHIVSFNGPIDHAWISLLEESGAKVVDTAYPFSLVVNGGGGALDRVRSLTTKTGVPLVRGIGPVPLESRVDPDLFAIAEGYTKAEAVPGLRHSNDGRLVVRVLAYPDQNERRLARRVARVAEPAGALGYDYPDAFLINDGDVWRLLSNEPGIAFIELVHERKLLGNLAAKGEVHAVENVWALGYTGADVDVNHNDSGIDPHADFNTGTSTYPGTAAGGIVTAIRGKMTGTDNSHGTHTAGSVAGRGAFGSPSNTNGCGDQITPLSNAKGMAYGARLNANNLFDGGATTESDMMKWAQDNGSEISTNSWGYTNSYTYGSQASTIDRAVRDADTTEAGAQALTIVFAAGNDGSGASTVGNPGTAKNAITVGALYNARCGSYTSGAPSTGAGKYNQVVDFSGRGPSQGRVKPDITAVGANVLSTASDDSLATHSWDQTWTGANHELMPGTSMACPIVAGAAATFFESYKARFGAFPSPALAKAALINGATPLSGGTTTYTLENTSTGTYAQGWGRLNLLNSVQGPSGGTIKYLEQSTSSAVTTGVTRTYTFSVSSSAAPLKLSLVWTDPEAAGGSTAALKNNLDLIVTSPSGTVYRGNRFTGAWSTANPGTTTDTANNVENVYVQSPATGTWTVEVVGTNVTTNVTGMTGQDFAIVHSGAVTDLALGGGTPNFSLSASPTSLSIVQGSSGTSTITSSISGGFNSAVTLSASGLPSGATASFSTNPIAAPGSGSSTMTISVGSSTAAGTYTVTVTGTGGTLTRTTTVSLTVTATGGGNTIACGETKSGSLATTDARSTVRGSSYYADTYTFTPSTSGTATITLTSTAFDTWLVVKSSPTATTAIAQDDDSGGGTNSRISLSVTGGTTYYIEATSYSANATGAYSLAVSCSGGTVTVLSEGAESGAAGWTVSTNISGNNWVISANGRRTGSNGFRTNQATSTYPNNLDQSLISPAFSLAGRTSASLTYYYKRQTETSYDYFRVEVSTNGGTSWTSLSSTSGTTSGFTTTAGSGMISNTISLNSYVGQSNVKIRFRLTTDSSVVYWGVGLDDITVTAQ